MGDKTGFEKGEPRQKLDVYYYQFFEQESVMCLAFSAKGRPGGL